MENKGNAEMLLKFSSRYISLDTYIMFALSLFMYVFLNIFMYTHNNHCHRVTGNLQSNILFTYLYIHISGKAVPLQAQKGPEGSMNLRFPDFVTTTQRSW